MREILSCPVCGLPLAVRDKCYACSAGHSYDIAKQGYVNLLLGKGGSVHGDNALMITARRRFLSKGYYTPLVSRLTHMLQKYATEKPVLLDIGCGEGYYTEPASRAIAPFGGTAYAFDISKDALKAASQRRCATLFAASAYKIPVLDETVDIATLFFSPLSREEIFRVLRPGGLFITAYPGERHLWGLKRAIYDTPYLNRPEDTSLDGFNLIEKTDISKEILLPDNETLTDLFAMTPYYYKTGERDKAKLASLSSLTTEIAFHLCVYKKNYNTEQKQCQESEKKP